MKNSSRVFVALFLVIKMGVHMLSTLSLRFRFIKNNSVYFRVYSDKSFLLYTTLQELALGLAVLYAANSLRNRLGLLLAWYLLLYTVSSCFPCDFDYLLLFRKCFQDTLLFVGAVPIVLSHMSFSIVSLHTPLTQCMAAIHEDFFNVAIFFTLYIFSIVSFQDV